MQQKVIDHIKLKGNLPQIPGVMLKLIELFSNDEVSVDQLTSTISTDPSLTSRLMEIIGSAYINLPKEINSIESAVVYLGMDTIRNIAISSSAMHVFKQAEPTLEFDLNTFWRHSYTCAVLAGKIARHIKYPSPDEAFLTGLMHDIGRLVLIRHFPEAYSALLADTPDEYTMLTMERKTFETDAPQVSAWLFNKWKLNPLASDAVLFVNEPLDQIKDSLVLVRILYVANQLAVEPGAPPDPAYTALTGVNPESLETIVSDTHKEVSGIASSLGLSPETTEKEAVRIEDSLTAKVRNFSLFYGTLNSLVKASGLDAILGIADKGLKILFNVKRIFYFLADDSKNFLNGFCDPRDKQHKIINSIAIPGSSQTSQIAGTLRSKKIRTCFPGDESQKPAISDLQIIRLLGTPGMACIPIQSSQDPIGTIVLGITLDHLADLEAGRDLVTLFARQVCICIEMEKFRKEQTAQIHNERMAAFSGMARKIVHEVNNPIVIIKNYLKMMSMKLPDKHPVQSELHVIGEEIVRVSELIGNLSDFSRPQIREFSPTDVNQLCKSILLLIRTSLLAPKGIQADLKIDPSIPLVKTDPNGIKQVLINLFKNAAEAMDTGGDIHLETRFIPDSSRIMIDEKKRVPGAIEITFSDTGPGIPDDIKQRIFEPYNSTKKQEHSGLGLSIVHTIITQLNGTISCESVKGRGTKFTIVLPVASKKNMTNEVIG